MSQKDWQKKPRVEELTEEELVKEVKAKLDPVRAGAEPEMPINGYSAGFITDKVKKLLSGDLSVIATHTPAQKEAIFIKALQILGARLDKLEKDLGA